MPPGRPAPAGPPGVHPITWAVAAAVYGAVVALFAVKYLGRVSAGGLVGAGYGVAAGAAVWGATRLPAPWRRSPWAGAAVVAACAVVAAVALARVDPASLRVDRHLMIETVVENVREGLYPYAPRYVNGPGPSPGYFVLVAPFYLAGEVGYVTVAALAGFAVLAYARLGGPRALVAVALVAAALPFWYEVVTRSTLVANGILAAALVGPMAERRGGRTASAVAGWGALAGLLLSTRSLMALAVGGVALYAYVRPATGWPASGWSTSVRSWRWGALAGFGAVAAAVFALTVLPVWLWSPAEFAERGPLAIQSSLTRPAYAVAAVAAAAVVGLAARTPLGLLLGLGLALTLAVGLPFAEDLAEDGWAGAVDGSLADIAYLTVGMPLLALGLAAGPRRAGPPATPGPRRIDPT